MAFWVRAFAVLAILCASAQTNHRYFYCEAMGLLQADPCAAVERGERDVALTNAHEDCCRVVTLLSLPNASGAAAFVIAPAPFVAWIQPAPRLHRSSFARTHARGSERGPPTPSRRQAELMISLT